MDRKSFHFPCSAFRLRLLRQGLAMILLCSFFLFLVSSYAAVGKSGWTIFKKVQSAKFREITTTGMVRGDLSGVFYNPAVLGTGTEREIFFVSELGFTEDKFGGILYGQPALGGTLAGGFIYYDAGLMELNWIENDELVTKNVTAQRDLMGLVSYGRIFGKKFFAGSTIKFANSEVAEVKSASAFALDLGALYFPYKSISISFAAQNLGVSTKYISESNPLPSTIYIGGGYYTQFGRYFVNPGVGLSYNITDSNMIPGAGVEIGYDLVSINAGYRFSSNSEANLHLGLGINWKNIDFGYGYVPGMNLNPVHQFSFGYRFSGKVLP